MELCEIKMKDQFELIPNDSRKSFYRKAMIIIDNDNNQYLRSYDTIVAYKDNTNKVHRIWDGWSATTGRHIKAFTGMNKAEFEKLPVEC